MNDILTVTVEDGTFDAYVFPAQTGAPVVVLLQEVFGVNEGIRQIAAELVAEGFTVVCPDLFWRVERGLQLSSNDASDVERAFSIYGSLDFDRTAADVVATIDASRAMSRDGKVAVMGFCLGGLMTFLAAARGTVDAAVGYYGGGTQNYLDEARNINAPLLLHLAGSDQYIPAEAQEAISQAAEENPWMKVHVYPKRDHAFVRPGGDHYHRADALAANARTIDFLRLHLVLKRL
jgi:carboxymethylenebutenolidase